MALLAAQAVLQLPIVVAKAVGIRMLADGALTVTLDRAAPAAVAVPVRLIGTACHAVRGSCLGLVGVVEGVTVLLLEGTWEATRRRMRTHGLHDDATQQLAYVAAGVTLVAVPLLCFTGAGAAYAFTAAAGQLQSTLTCFVGQACVELTLYLGKLVMRNAVAVMSYPFRELWRWLTTARAETSAAAAAAGSRAVAVHVTAHEPQQPAEEWLVVDLTESLLSLTRSCAKPLLPSDEGEAEMLVSELEQSAEWVGCKVDRSFMEVEDSCVGGADDCESPSWLDGSMGSSMFGTLGDEEEAVRTRLHLTMSRIRDQQPGRSAALAVVASANLRQELVDGGFVVVSVDPESG